MTTEPLLPASAASGRRRRSPALNRASLPVRALKGLVLVVGCTAILGPFLIIISTSLASSGQVSKAGGLVIWPHHPSLDSYRAVLSGGVVTRALIISIGITVVGTLMSLTVSTLLAYSLSWPGTFAHKPILLIVLFTLLFGPGIIPNYLTVKTLGLIDSYWSLILPVLVSGFDVILIRAFFLDLPREILDSARIDGASDLQILARIVLPLSKPILAVMALFYAVGYWNAFFNALLYMNDNSKWPLQLVLRTYVVNQTPIGVQQLPQIGVGAPPPQQSIQMATLVIALIPILVVYPFLQRHFTKGVLIGAVKG